MSTTTRVPASAVRRSGAQRQARRPRTACADLAMPKRVSRTMSVSWTTRLDRVRCPCSQGFDTREVSGLGRSGRPRRVGQPGSRLADSAHGSHSGQNAASCASAKSRDSPRASLVGRYIGSIVAWCALDRPLCVGTSLCGYPLQGMRQQCSCWRGVPTLRRCRDDRIVCPADCESFLMSSEPELCLTGKFPGRRQRCRSSSAPRWPHSACGCS